MDKTVGGHFLAEVHHDGTAGTTPASHLLYWFLIVKERTAGAQRFAWPIGLYVKNQMLAQQNAIARSSGNSILWLERFLEQSLAYSILIYTVAFKRIF